MRAVGSTGLEVFHDEWYKDSKAPYYHSDEEKNELLRTSDALKGHRTEIASFFADHEDKNERADFIKTFFDNTFTEMILSNGQRAGYRAFDTVFMMWRGSASDPEQRVIMKWSTVADHITGMIVLHEWLSPDEAVLPSVNEQLSLIGEAESKKDSAFVMPQDAIDYVLSSGSGFEDGKRRIYQQFLKQEGTEANVRFLRREYGIGGHSDAIPGTDYWLEYDAKGLHLSKLHDDGSKAVNLSWNVVEKRIGELIALGRYLSKAEIERISAEQSSTKADQSTAAPANEEEPVQRHYSLGDKVYLGVKEYEILAIDDHMVRLYDSEYPLFNEELSRSDFDRRIAENPLNDQPKENSGEQAVGVKPQAIGRLDYLDSNGHVGEQVEYDDEIQLVEQVKEDVDTGAPFTITLYRDQNGTTIPQDFLTDLGTPPKGFAVVDYAEGHREYLLNESIRMINLYALECFEEKADFSDLTAVPLAYSTSGDGEHSIQVDADLEHCRMLYAIDNEAVAQIQYADLGDMNEFLVNMTFDELVAFAEHEYAAQHKEPEQTQEPQLTPPAARKKDKTAPLTLLPEIPDTERSEYHISDDLLGVGTPSKRYARNIRAITVLKKVEAEHRLATPEEQSVLAQYVGWGGLADCFDERNSHYAELKELLSDEEYEAARESTLTAFYTPPVVIRSMYQVLERLGFQRGNILEPSCGVGNFIGMRPGKLADSKIYGVELDSISGRIAQQLYQKSSIAVRGFEKTDLPDSFFDAAIGNIPFGSFKIVDKRYDKYLDNDLDLSGSQWTPIGDGDNHGRFFAGTFNGQHHKIMNLNHHYTGHEVVRNGLFEVVSGGGTLKNLLVIDADIDSNDGSLLAGILADWVNGGTVENCYTSGKIENKVGYKMVGGLIGQCTSSTQVKGCGSDATVISTASKEDDADTVGGLIGQWENSADSSSITDCWFGGSVFCNNKYSAVGGILGANFDFYGEPGVTIRNCLVATKDITSEEPGNVTWIAAVATPHITNCIWPNTPPKGVEMDNTKYPEYNGTYLAVVKLVLDPSGNSASPDPDFDQNQCGSAVSNFTSEDVLADLKTNASAGVKWVAGIGHPTFAWDEWHISADYSAVDAAITAAKAIDSNLYSNYAGVEKAIDAVDRSKSKAEQSAVDAMAKAIEDAIAALQYKDADYTKVDAAIAKANALNKNDYRDFSAVKAALDAVARDKNITEQAKVDAMAKAIEDAINALVRKSSGGGSSSPSYSVTIPNKTENGTVTVSPRSAEKGDTVTITAKPDGGYQLDDLTVTDKNGKELKLTDKGNGKYTFTMPASKVTVTPTFVKIAQQPTGKTFSDVAKSDWFADAVAYVTDKGLMNGTGRDTFSPSASTTRGMLMTVLARYAGEDTTGGSPWYQKGMNWAKAKGVSDGTNPEVNITREQLVTMLYRYAGSPAASGSLDNFSDASTVSSYAVNAMQWAVANSIVNGSNGKLNPKNSATRAEVAAILMRFCEMSK